MKRILFSLVLLLALGCENARFGSREKGALGGAALGAGLGAIVGNQSGNSGAGVAIGSAFGALAGALIGQGLDSQDAALEERRSKIDDQQRQIEENRRLIEELKAKGIDVRQTDRGVVINLPDVLFEFDKARLTRDADETVSEIAGIVKSQPGRNIVVEGHTDAVGTVAYNQRLSRDRARSVADGLTQEGVDRRKITTRGLGESQPIASNKTESGRQRNRRVEVIIENR